MPAMPKRMFITSMEEPLLIKDAAKKAVPSRSTPAIIVFFLPNFDEMKPIGIYETTATPVAIMSVVL